MSVMLHLKKLFALAIIVLSIFSNSDAQNQVHLSVTYLPDHQYKQKIEQVFHMDVKFGGVKKKDITSADLTTPTKTTASTRNESVIATGNLTNDTSFPLKMTIIKSIGA